MNVNKILVDNEKAFVVFLSKINKNEFAFDCETTSLKIQELSLVGISFYDGGDSVWYLPFYHNTQEHQLDFTQCKDRLLKLFIKANKIIGHNLVYDMQVIKKYGIYPEDSKWFDTMVAQHLINENERKGLKVLAKRHFNYDMQTYEDVTKGKNFSNTSVKDALNYGCDDSVQTYKLYKLFRPQLAELELDKLFFKIEMPFLRCIIDMEQNGILIDKDRLDSLKIQVVKKINTVKKQIIKNLPEKYKSKDLFGNDYVTINLDSPKQLAQLLFRDLNLPISDRSEKTGVPSVGTPSIRKIIDKHPILPLLIKYKEYQKLNNAFICALPKHISNDGRVHCNFLDTGTVTSRLACSNPNLQQLPVNNKIDVRSCFIASPNKKLVVLDYNQEELRLTAFISQDKDMMKAYNNKLDLHLLTANKIFNLGLTEQELKDGTIEHEQAKEKYNEERSKAKTTVFSILYGVGKNTLSARLGVTTDEAEKLIRNYYASFPQVKDSIDEIHKQVSNTGIVKNYFGRYRHFFKIDGSYPNSAFRQSFNFTIQSMGADLLRVSMNNIRVFLKEHDDEAKLLFTVHDELCLEVPQEKAEFYLAQVKEIMESSLKINPPLLVSGNFGNNYSEAKPK